MAPQHFGNLGRSLFTMFTVLTVENWPSVAGDVMAREPLAWIFFVTFIVVTAFFILNSLIGVIVSSMQSEVDSSRWEEDQELELEQHTELMNEIRALSEKVDRLMAESSTTADRNPSQSANASNEIGARPNGIGEAGRRLTPRHSRSAPGAPASALPSL
ncbi:ion transporter [Actinoallomurus spadix]|uniref:Ion transport domain-containing protein n=1 Tax=Actinoallomurus spadix TaxID=79912 RepID=A0ABP3GLZ3_9ACTN|nr:ion transporter [Actinoallomurus spadix]MCO5986712.1 ion transporter [Actinoallomurus spadix]